MTIQILLFAIFFFILSVKKPSTAIFLLFLLLPTYLIRFTIFGLPSTLLEIMILTITAATVFSFKHDKQRLFYPFRILTKKQNQTVFIGLICIVLGATINIFVGNNIIAALGIWRAFFIEPLLLFYTLLVLSKHIDIKKYILNGLFVGAAVTSTLSIYQHFTGFMVPHAFWANRDTYRVTGWWGFPNGVGMYLAPITLLAIGSFLKQKKLSYIILIGAAMASIVFAKSTGALIGVIAGLLVYLIINKKTRIFTIVLSVIAFIILLLTPTDNLIKQELLMQDYSGQLRIEMWGETTQYLSEHPIVGAGLRNYTREIEPYRINKNIEIFHHPHNMFLTFWVETGILGLIGYLLIIIWTVKIILSILLSKDTSNNKNIILLSVLTCFFVMGLVDSPYIKNDIAVLFWGVMGLLVREV